MNMSSWLINRRTGKSLTVAVLLIAGTMAAAPAMADRHRTTTVVRETIYHSPSYHSPSYHSPSHVIVQPSVIIPISNSVYIGVNSHSHVTAGHRQSTVYREISRHDSHHDRHRDNYYDRGFRHSGHGNAFGHRNKEPARGRWSGADRHREVIYVNRDGRRNSAYREAERRSVVIRERNR